VQVEGLATFPAAAAGAGGAGTTYY